MERFSPKQLVSLVICFGILAGMALAGPAQARSDTPRVWPAPVPQSTFTDLDPGSELALAAEYCYEKGVFVGYGDGTFRPWEPISRDTMVLLAYRIGWRAMPQWVGDSIHITRIEFADRYGGFTWWRSPWSHYPYEKMRRGHLALLLYRHQGVPISWRPMKLTGFGGLRPDAETAWRLARYSIPGLRFIGGYARGGHVRNSDHYRGEAFDAGGSTAAMHQLRDWLRANFLTLNVKYIIHDRRIIYRWGSVYYRGTNGHWYHVHASFWGW